jgi:hypothetical protein
MSNGCCGGSLRGFPRPLDASRSQMHATSLFKKLHHDDHKGLNPSRVQTLLAVLTFLVIGYYNITPLIGVDCWWHMRFAEYFLQHGEPVLYDPFAVQGSEPILAFYPDLFPGLLFLWVFQQFSYLGLNVLRIVVYLAFIGALLLVVRKNCNDCVVLLQINLLALAMNGRVLLQPDLFNYVLFVAWIYLLENVVIQQKNSTPKFLALLLIEQIWVNTHPSFFYYGLFFGGIYLTWAILVKWRGSSEHAGSLLSPPVLSAYLISLGVSWLFNPLGWRALQSLSVCMLDPSIPNLATVSFQQSLSSVNTIFYVGIFASYLATRPWRTWPSKWHAALYCTLLISLVAPSLAYERCLPFLCTFCIISQARNSSYIYPRHSVFNTISILVCIFLSVIMALDRQYSFSTEIANHLGLTKYGSNFRGVGLDHVESVESLRDTNIINQIASPGNCLADRLELSSSAVWHCKDKPFFQYGHGAVLNTRHKEFEEVRTNLASEEARRIIYQYDIRTIILTDRAERIINSYPAISDFMQLLFIDPTIAILARRDTITNEQWERIRTFYANFEPSTLDYLRFKPQDRIVQYFLLWFSAEMTGNNGNRYLAVVKQRSPTEKLSQLQNQLSALLPSKAPNSSYNSN